MWFALFSQTGTEIVEVASRLGKWPDYIFTDKIASAGSHAAGPHILNAKVSLSGNTEHYIWCFALGDDGIDAYKSGFINVFGLND